MCIFYIMLRLTHGIGMGTICTSTMMFGFKVKAPNLSSTGEISDMHILKIEETRIDDCTALITSLYNQIIQIHLLTLVVLSDEGWMWEMGKK